MVAVRSVVCLSFSFTKVLYGEERLNSARIVMFAEIFVCCCRQVVACGVGAFLEHLIIVG